VLGTSAFRTLGVDKTSGCCKVALYAFKKGKPFCQCLKIANVKLLDNPEVNDRDSFLSQNLPLIISCLEASSVLVREFEIPNVHGQNKAAAIAFQAEPNLPYSIEDAILVPLYENRSNSELVNIFTTKKELLKQHLERFQEETGVEAEAVSCVQGALFSFNAFLPMKNGHRLILHLSEKDTACVLINGKSFVGARTLPLGEASFLEALANDWNLSAEEARKLLFTTDLGQFEKQENSHFLKKIKRWNSELSKIVIALSIGEEIAEPIEIIMTGDFSTCPSFLTLLQNTGNHVLNCPPDLKDLKSSEMQTHAVALGLAVAFLPCSSNQINFRSGEFAYSKPLKHLKKPLMAYFGLCFLLSLLLFAGGSLALGKQEKRIVSKAKIFLEAKKISQISDDEPISSLISKLKASRGTSSKSTYPLLPQLPRVSDFLAWISNLPPIADSQTEKIRFERLVYSMGTRPNKKKPKDKYEIKVDFEFATSSPRKARELHETLLKSTDIINTKDRFQWNASSSSYKASFLLKDKTFFYE